MWLMFQIGLPVPIFFRIPIFFAEAGTVRLHLERLPIKCNRSTVKQGAEYIFIFLLHAGEPN